MIEQCLDMNVVREFMLRPEISRYATEYGADLEAVVFTTKERSCWISYTLNQEVIGMISLHLITGTMGEFHPYILRKFKAKYNHMVKEFFKWFIDNVPEQICKLNVAIPEQFKGAILAAETVGMKHEGLDRMSYLSKSGPCNRILLGITRREMLK